MKFRTRVGSVVLLACACALGLRATAAPPELPRDSYKKAADADLKFLQTRLADLAKKEAAGQKPLDGRVKPALGVALVLAVYADALGDEALHTGALEAAEAIEKRDFKAADAVAQKLAVKPGNAGKPRDVPKPFKDEQILEVTQSTFRNTSVGGLGIDKDIRDMLKRENPKPIDPAAVEILAVRTAVISEFAVHTPNERALRSVNERRDWDKIARDSVEVSKQLAEEAAKGEKADTKKLDAMLRPLIGRCDKCHVTCELE